MGVFGFFVILGLLAFSTYKSTNTSTSNVIINIWGTIEKNTIDNFISKFKQDKNLQFNYNYIYKNLETIDNDLVEAIATGKAPDVILIPQTLEKRYLDKVLMITSIPERTFRDTFIQEAGLYVQPNGLFALPLFVDPLVMYWNKNLFASAGYPIAPTKWTEFPILAGKLSQTDSNGNIKSSVASFGEYSNVNNAKALVSTLVMQAGSSIVSYENNFFRSKLNSQSTNDIMIPAVSALQFYTEFSNPKKVNYSWNRSISSSLQSFLGEDLATYFGFASEYSSLKEKNPNLNFDVAMMPQILDAKTKITFGNIYGFSILKASKNPQAAFNLITQLISNDAITALVNSTDFAPARNDVIVKGIDDPIKTIFYNSAIISQGWIDPDAGKTDQIFKNMIENITSGLMSIQASVAKASTELDNLLQ
jgi:ABC-type glycerol-3-phosphate transport system substrate-binding protein